MGIEIERKFLVAGEAWRAQALRSQRMLQGYLIDADVVQAQATRCSLRVRIGGEDRRSALRSVTQDAAVFSLTPPLASQVVLPSPAARERDVGGQSSTASSREQAWLNIKSANLGVARQEYEYPIPVADAERMLRDFCNGVIEKTRHYVPHAGFTYEVDEFFGDNTGLVVAELELDAVDQAFARPDWLGREVSDRLRYYNLHLLRHPYSRWDERERAGD